jgi:hypothetical protein
VLRRLAGRGGEEAGWNYSSRRMRWLWLAVPLFFVWANSHGGFVAGYCVFAAYLVCRSVEVLAMRGAAGRGLAARFALMLVVAGLATCVNPYGPDLHVWLAGAMDAPPPEITEWHPLSFTSPLVVPLAALLFFAGASLVRSRRPLDFTHTVLLAAILAQALMHQRHIAFFAIACGFWLGGHFASLLAQWRVSAEAEAHEADTTPAGKRHADTPEWLTAGTILASAVLAIVLVGRLSSMPVPSDRYPVAALRFMADYGLTGRVVVTYNWAQYALAALGAREPGDEGLRVQCDGRFDTCYSQAALDAHFDFILGDAGPRYRRRGPNSPPFDPRRVLRDGSPDLVLIDRRQKHAVGVMLRQTNDWLMLYQDEIAQVWGRAAVFGHPRGREYFHPQARAIGDEPQVGSVPWPAFPDREKFSAVIADLAGTRPFDRTHP